MKSIVMICMTITACLLISCETEDSENVNQDRIWTSYEVRYDANEDITVAIAKFRFGGATGTRLELSGSAAVYFNNEELPYSSRYLGHAREFAGFISEGTFEYIDVNGSALINAIPTVLVSDFPDSFTGLATDQAYTFEWDGPLLLQGEEISLDIENVEGGGDASFSVSDEGLGEIILGVNKLELLASGDAVCELERSRTDEPLEVTEVGGILTISYKAIDQTIEIR